MKSYSLTETAKMVRNTLKQAFPNTTFSVRSRSYSGGCSIDVRWTDGPTSKQVDAILNRFEGRGFDGMTDCSFYCGQRMYKGEKVEFVGAFVSGQRELSFEAMKKAALEVAFQSDLPLNEVIRETWTWKGQEHESCRFSDGSHVDYSFFLDSDTNEPRIAHDSYRGEYYNNLCNTFAHNMSFEEQQMVELPEYIEEKEEPKPDPTNVVVMRPKSDLDSAWLVSEPASC